TSIEGHNGGYWYILHNAKRQLEAIEGMSTTSLRQVSKVTTEVVADCYLLLVHTAQCQEVAGSNRGNVHDKLAASIEGHNRGYWYILHISKRQLEAIEGMSTMSLQQVSKVTTEVVADC
ncbi:hypothetical protein D0Y65_030440, partial [Glycine soja]